MRLSQRIRQLEKTVTAMTGNNRERETVIVLRKCPQVPGETLMGYKDRSGTIWSMDRAQWPAGQRPQGILEEVWNKHVKKK